MSNAVEEALRMVSDPQLNRLYQIMQHQPLTHSYLNDERISFRIDASAATHYTLKLVDSLRVSEKQIQAQSV